MFVGRRDELLALGSLLPLIRDGGAAAALVVAPPGLGKTRLLGEVAHRVDFPLVRLHGYEPAREIPFSTAAGLLRELTGVGEAGERLDALLFGEAARGGAETLRVCEAALRSLSAYGPLTVVVDDLQWSDRESLSLLHYLLAGSLELPVLLVAASRPADEPRTLWSALESLLSPGRFVGLELGPLHRDEGLQLVGGLAPQLSEDAAAELWRRAQGSPFWLEALARGGEGSADPAALLQSRFGGLDADPARLFTLLVAAARPLALADAQVLLGWEEARVRTTASRLVNHALVVQEGGSVRVAHDLLREAAERRIPEDERRRFHALLARWLESTVEDDLDLLSRALEHRRSAGLPAGDLALRIARLPQRRLLGRAGLDLLSAIEGPPELAVALAALASELAEWEEALERWGRLAESLPSSAERAQAALSAADAAVRLMRPDQTYRLAERARALAPDDPLVRIEADVREGQALRWLENRVAEAQERTVSAVAASERLVAESGGSDALDERSRRLYVAALRADLDSGIRAGDADKVRLRADEIVSSAREPAEVLAARSDALFSLIMFEGLPAEVEPRARTALAEAQRLVLPTAEVEASHWLGWALRELGRLEEAEEVTRRTVALAERVGPPARFGLPNVRANALFTQASRGDWRAPVQAMAEQVALSPEPHYRLNVSMMRLPALVRFSVPDRAQLELELAAMRADAEAAGCHRCWWQNVLLSAEALARAGDLTGALRALDDWHAALPQPRPGPAARYAYVRALVGGDDRELFTHAAELATAAGQHLLRLWIDLDAAQRDPAALRSVVEEAAEMGALSEQQLAISRLRELGVRWRPAARADDGALSARERQIAAMVAAGASNPEIAQSLFLSRKTVERHVTHILAKLGLRNRIELAGRFRPDA